MLKIYDIYTEEGVDLEKFEPSEKGFALLIELEIGIEGQQGSELFRFNLCDKKGLINFILNNDDDFNVNGITSLNGYNLFVIKNYNYKTLTSMLNVLLEKSFSKNKTWSQIAFQLNNYFYWEYQNEFNNNED